jgi:hypothetical protein
MYVLVHNSETFYLATIHGVRGKRKDKRIQSHSRLCLSYTCVGYNCATAGIAPLIGDRSRAACDKAHALAMSRAIQSDTSTMAF